MARKFVELSAKMSPESKARAEAKAKKMLAEISLNESPTAHGECFQEPASQSTAKTKRERNRENL